MDEPEVKIEVVEEESSKNVESEAASVSFEDDNVNKTELTTATTLKMSPEELNSFFSHEIFGPPSKGHDCSVCGRSFQFRYQLAVHAKHHTLPNEAESEEDKDWQIKEEESSETSMYAIGTLPPCSDTPALSLSTPTPNPKNHICTICGRGFSRKEHLTNHMNKHNGISPHACNICPKRFSRKDHLDSHKKAHDADFKCHVCLKTFSRKEHLVAHVQWHTGASPHRCNHCKKAFTRREHLVAHVRQHTGESPHVCRFCAKSFTRKEHVVNHERSHTGETPFKCTICPRAFSRRDHLVVHTRQHTGETPYKCKECNKSFTRKEHLVNHSRQHAGEAYSFKCNFCPKSFTRNDLLVNHVTNHTQSQLPAPAALLPFIPVVPNEPLLQSLNSKNSDLNFQEQFGQVRNEYTCEICAKSFQLQNNLIFHHMTVHALAY